MTWQKKPWLKFKCLILEEIIEKEVDPGLGNGGLGRLAACFYGFIGNISHSCNGLRYSL